MNQNRTLAIVLRRTDYAEADRVVTLLTPRDGLISVMVKGARRQGSKLAGGIELFSENDIVYIKGRGELSHLISGRMRSQYHRILEDYDRVSLGYEVIKHIHKAASQFDEPQLYDLLKSTLEALNEPDIPVRLIECWVKLNLLRILGQQPNLTHDIEGNKLRSDRHYILLPDDGAFREDEKGDITPEHIKCWRVLITTSPQGASKIRGLSETVTESLDSINNLFDFQMP